MKLIPYAGCDGMYWTPVLWDGAEDPDWFKSGGLEAYVPNKRLARKLLLRIQQPNIVPDIPFGPDWVKQKVEENERGYGRKS